MHGLVYPAAMIGGIIFSAVVWGRLTQRPDFGSDPRLPSIYMAGLVGALVGAKLIYMLSEGWMFWPQYAEHPMLVWRAWLTGKTVTGALLGGYLAVEVAKKSVGYARPTGDLFAVIAPFGLAMGRFGCWDHGCCLGIPMHAAWFTFTDVNGIARWPSVQVELVFNLAFTGFALIAWRRRIFQGQLFHVYLIGYGGFRFLHEFLRDTPHLVGTVSGYQIAALAILLLGVVRYAQRAGNAVEVPSAAPETSG